MSIKGKEAELRQTAFEQSKFDAYKSKFGLFSQPGYLATAEDTYARPLDNHRDDEGKVKLGKKNFMVSESSTKKNKGCFSLPDYQCDTYADPPRVYQIEKERATRMYQSNNAAWKHNGNFSDKKIPYPYASDPINEVQSKRLPDCTVKTGPKGFFTTPAKRGASTPGITIGKVPEHVPDAYESYENWLKAERIKQKEKRLYGDFRTTSFGKKNFTENKELYKANPKGRPFKDYVYPGAKHQHPFMSTCPTGFTIGKYPDHMSNAVRETPEQNKFEKPWKHTGVLGTVPSRSVAKIYQQDFE